MQLTDPTFDVGGPTLWAICTDFFVSEYSYALVPDHIAALDDGRVFLSFYFRQKDTAICQKKTFRFYGFKSRQSLAFLSCFSETGNLRSSFLFLQNVVSNRIKIKVLNLCLRT
jgi:hypothetical protein